VRHQRQPSLVPLAFALAAACTAPPPSMLEPFADAARFLPVDLESVAFSAAPYQLPEEPTDGRIRWALAAARFEPPEDIGVGRFHGVVVVEYRPGTQPIDVGRQDRRPDAVVAGAPLWRDHISDMRTDEAMWFAWVEDRFFVYSFDRPLLETAMQRRTRLADLLAPFPEMELVPGSATHAVAVQPRPADRTYWGRPVPDQPLVTWVQRTPTQLAVAHRLPLPPSWRAFCERQAVGSASARTIDGWQVTAYPLAEDEHFDFLAFLLAGFAVFL